VKGSAPERTCIGCRESTGAAYLMRLVASPEGLVVVDLKGNLPGRGAWVHARPACLARGENAVKRALGGKGGGAGIDGSGLAEKVRDAVHRALGAGLSMASAGGGLSGGRAAVEQALTEKRAQFVVVASDAADRTVRGVQQAVALHSADTPLVVVPLTATEIGELTGKASRAVAAVLDVPCSVHLRRQLRRLVSLG
jgi:uncharacterized protein